MLHIGTWLWGDKYPPQYVENLKAGLARNLTTPYSFHVWKPQEADLELTRIPGCFARLRTFDPAWQLQQGIIAGDQIVVLDLDLVVVGNLDGAFELDDDFAILAGVNASNPCPFNGSVWMLRAGQLEEMWSGFSLEAAGEMPFHEFPDDQAWFAHMMPDAGRLTPADGFYAFRKPGWNQRADQLPDNAKIVAFPGHRDPAHFKWIGWVEKHWRS